MTGSLVYSAVLSVLLISAGVSDAYSVGSRLRAESEDAGVKREASVSEVESALDRYTYRQGLPLELLNRLNSNVPEAARKRSVPLVPPGIYTLQDVNPESGDPPTTAASQHQLPEILSEILYKLLPEETEGQDKLSYRYDDNADTVRHTPSSASYRDTAPCPAGTNSVGSKQTDCPCVIPELCTGSQTTKRQIDIGDEPDFILHKSSIKSQIAELYKRLESLSRSKSARPSQYQGYTYSEIITPIHHYHSLDYPLIGINIHPIRETYPGGHGFSTSYVTFSKNVHSANNPEYPRKEEIPDPEVPLAENDQLSAEDTEENSEKDNAEGTVRSKDTDKRRDDDSAGKRRRDSVVINEKDLNALVDDLISKLNLPGLNDGNFCKNC